MNSKTIFRVLIFFLSVVSYNNVKGQNDSLLPPPPKDVSFYVIDEKPEFPGGVSAMLKYIAENTIYPELAKKKGISGKVFVQFIVDKDGSITDVKIIRGVSPCIDEEAVRVIRSMPKWKPGYLDGKPVKVSFQTPINFTIY